MSRIGGRGQGQPLPIPLQMRPQTLSMLLPLTPMERREHGSPGPPPRAGLLERAKGTPGTTLSRKKRARPYPGTAQPYRRLCRRRGERHASQRGCLPGERGRACSAAEARAIPAHDGEAHKGDPLQGVPPPPPPPPRVCARVARARARVHAQKCAPGTHPCPLPEPARPPRGESRARTAARGRGGKGGEADGLPCTHAPPQRSRSPARGRPGARGGPPRPRPGAAARPARLTDHLLQLVVILVDRPGQRAGLLGSHGSGGGSAASKGCPAGSEEGEERERSAAA